MVRRAIQIRRLKELARRPGHRPPRASILIVCEGAKTEPSYFKALRAELRLQTAEVEVCGRECRSDPLKVVEYAVQRRAERERAVAHGEALIVFDEIWCVVDRDRHATLGEAESVARAHRIKLVLSVPCFEYWYLLHFTETTRLFHGCGDVVRDLEKHLPGYRKSADVFATLWPRTETAIGRATRIAARNVDAHADPSTRVYELVARLRRLASE